MSPALHPVSVFTEIDTREDGNIHKAISCKFLSNNICTVVEEWHHDYFCLGYFFSSTHFELVTLKAQKVWRQCVLVFAHDRYSHAGSCTAFLLSTDCKLLVLFQCHLIPCDSCLRQNVVIEFSDLYTSSPLSSIFDNGASISPCCTIPIQF